MIADSTSSSSLHLSPQLAAILQDTDDLEETQELEDQESNTPPDGLGAAEVFFTYLKALLESDLTPTQRWVATVIAKHANGGYNSFAKVETLARETGFSKDTIIEATKVLVREKWLKQTYWGQGRSSKLANCYDLTLPEDSETRNFDGSKSESPTLQSRNDRSQSRNDRSSKSESPTTSVPRSTPRSTAASTTEQSHQKGKDQGTKEPRRGRDSDGDSYWVGISARHPAGYFIRVAGNTRPKGKVVRVNLTGREVQTIFMSVYGECVYPHEQRVGMMLTYASRQNPGCTWLRDIPVEG